MRTISLVHGFVSRLSSGIARAGSAGARLEGGFGVLHGAAWVPEDGTEGGRWREGGGPGATYPMYQISRDRGRGRGGGEGGRVGRGSDTSNTAAGGRRMEGEARSLKLPACIHAVTERGKRRRSF